MNRRMVALFLLLFGLYYSGTRFCLDGYELEYVLSAMNIYHGNGPAMAPGFNTCPGIHDTDGDVPVYQRQNYLQSYLSAPFYAVGAIVFGEEPTIPDRGMYWEIPWGPVATVAMLNPLLAALTAILVGLMAGCFGLKPGQQVALAAMFGLTTMMWHYAGLGMEVMQTAAVTTAAYMVIKYRQTGLWHWLIPSLVAIAAVPNCKKYSAVFILPIVIYLIWSILQHHRKRGLWIAFIVILTSVIGFMLMVAGVIHRFHHDPNLFPHLLRTFTSGGFSSLDLAYALTISPGEGILIFNPLLFFAVTAWSGFYRRHRAEALLFIGLVFIPLIVLWKVPHVLIDEEWGPRYLLVTLPFLFVAGYRGLFRNRQGSMKTIFIIIIIMSILVNWVGSLVLGFKVLDAAMHMGVPDYMTLVFTPSVSQIWLSIQCVASQIHYQFTGRHLEISYRQFKTYTGLGGRYETHRLSLKHFDNLAGGVFVVRWVMSEAGTHWLTPKMSLLIRLVSDWIFMVMIAVTVFFGRRRNRQVPVH